MSKLSYQERLGIRFTLFCEEDAESVDVHIGPLTVGILFAIDSYKLSVYIDHNGIPGDWRCFDGYYPTLAEALAAARPFVQQKKVWKRFCRISAEVLGG